MKTKNPKGAGRKPALKTKKANLCIRLFPEQMQAFKEYAKSQGITLTELMTKATLEVIEENK